MKQHIGVIGCGYWGKNLVRNFYELGVLAGVCEKNLQTQNTLSENYPEIEIFTGIPQMLKSPKITGVAIASPAAFHYEHAKMALNAGKHVFVEKPLSLSLLDGEELCQLAEKEGLQLMVGHLLWYHPAVRKIKELIDNGELGKINFIASHRLNFGKIRQEENILWSFAPHDISVILGLLGEEPITVTSHSGEFLNHGIADVTTSFLNFKGGTQAHLFVSWLHPFKEQKLVVVGNKKMVVFDDVEQKQKLMIYPHKVEWNKLHPEAKKSDGVPIKLEKAEPLKVECSAFIEAIQKGAPAKTDGYEGLRVLRVLKNCQESLEKGGLPVHNNNLSVNENFWTHHTTEIDKNCKIGSDTKIWHFSHVLSGSQIGESCSIGQNVVIGPNVSVGNHVKIQNNVSVYDGVELEDFVFCGPSMVFTNVTNPRSHVSRKHEFKKTLVKKGATLGANCTIVCGTTIGEYAFVGAGAVVTKDVKPFSLVIGNPAKHAGWISKSGIRMQKKNKQGLYTCPDSGEYYKETNGELSILSSKKTAAINCKNIQS